MFNGEIDCFLCGVSSETDVADLMLSVREGLRLKMVEHRGYSVLKNNQLDSSPIDEINVIFLLKLNKRPT